MDKEKSQTLSLLYSERDIQIVIEVLAKQISLDYEGKEVVLVCNLKGAFMFFSDLCKRLSFNPEIDFMITSSYQGTTESSGEVEIIKDLHTPIKGKHVLIVEDIVDTGLTYAFVKKHLGLHDPASIKIASLLDKPSQRLVDITVDYKGFFINNQFVVGYGMDYEGYYRNLPYVAILSEKGI